MTVSYVTYAYAFGYGYQTLRYVIASNSFAVAYSFSYRVASLIEVRA